MPFLDRYTFLLCFEIFNKEANTYTQWGLRYVGEVYYAFGKSVLFQLKHSHEMQKVFCINECWWAYTVHPLCVDQNL